MKAFIWIVTLASAPGGAGALPSQEIAKPVQSPASLALPPNTASAPFPELSGEQAWKAFRAGSLFLDARQRTDHWQGHIPGALNLPFWAKDFERRLLDFLTGPKGDPATAVVVYCGGCCSTDSLMLARRLQDFGFKHIQIYRDGYPGWARAERPIEVGEPPKRGEVK
jgi:rhodanese-related sulfurtransferase